MTVMCSSVVIEIVIRCVFLYVNVVVGMFAGTVRRGFMFFFFQAEDGIRDLVRSRGLGDVYKRQYQRPIDGHAALHC